MLKKNGKLLLKSFLRLFPFARKAMDRDYLAATLGIYILSSFFKRVLLINNKVDFIVNYTSRVTHAHNINIEDPNTNTKVYGSFLISGGCYYQATNGISFGKGTIWSFGCHFISANHSFTNLDLSENAPPIKIGRYVWIGANCVILAGVEIGDYCIVGAGSIVTRSFPSYSILVGNPAKPLAARCRKCLDKINIGEEICNRCKSLILKEVSTSEKN